MKRVLVGALCAAALLSRSPSSAQSSPPAGGRAEAPRSREDLHKYVEAYFISNLQEQLELSNEQFARLLPAVLRLQAERRELQQRRQRAIQELGRLLGSGKASEASVGEALKELKKVETDWPATVTRQLETVDAQLSVVQQAKFRILETEVERKVRELLVGGRRLNAPGRRGVNRPDRP